MDSVGGMLDRIERRLELVHTRIEQFGSETDAGLLIVLTELTAVVRELAKRTARGDGDGY